MPLLELDAARPGGTAAVPRWEFEAAVARLELRLQYLEAATGSIRQKDAGIEVIELTPSMEHCSPVFESTSPHFRRAEEKELRSDQSDETETPHGAEHSHDRVYFGESVWNIPLVLDFSKVPVWDGLFSLILLAVNLGMQASFSGILLSDDFALAGVNVEEEVDNARTWRQTIAHDWRYMDLSQTSLVSRVCSGDGALILSTPQAELVNQINSFLGLGTDDFQPGFLQPGILLCMLCILHWSLCVYREFRSIWLALEAVAFIPTSRQTKMGENSIQSLSLVRFLFVFVTFVLRAIIASILLVAGISWLARTTSITELMLNAVALNGIMDVDELLFAGFTPVSVQRQIRKLKPIRMRYGPWRSQIESFLLFLLLGATMLVPYLVFLEPLGSGMVTIKWEMCGRNQTFVVAHNPDVQEIVGFVTRSGRSDEDLSLSELAVNTHTFQVEGPSQYIHFAASLQIFDQLRLTSLADAAGMLPFCPETEAFHRDSPLYLDPLVTPILHSRLRSATVALGEAPAESCAGLEELCRRPDARMLRLICGQTCGCTDPYASPWHKVQSQGCSDLCSTRAEAALETLTCEDQPQGQVWEEIWDSYAGSLSSYYGQEATQFTIWPWAAAVAQELRVKGCAGLQQTELQQEVVSKVNWCHGSETLFRPFSWLCPVSCGCLEHPQPPGCPGSCKVNNTGHGQRP